MLPVMVPVDSPFSQVSMSSQAIIVDATSPKSIWLSLWVHPPVIRLQPSLPWSVPSSARVSVGPSFSPQVPTGDSFVEAHPASSSASPAIPAMSEDRVSVNAGLQSMLAA